MSDYLITKFHTYLLTEKRVASNTFSAYKRDIDQFMTYLASRKVTLDSVTIADVKEFLRHMKDTLCLSARSITRKISSLKVLFSYMHEHLGLPNVAEDLIFPKVEKNLPNYLNEQEVQQLLMAANHDQTDIGVRNKVIVYLLYVSGMRVSELINVQLSHLHFDTGFIDVLGKGGKMRMVPVPAPMLTLLQEYLNTVHGTFTKNGSRSTDYLFPIFYAGKIKPITRQAVWVILNQLCKKSGLNRTVFPHQLRHSLATHMFKNGVDLRSLQMLLGHETIATVQIYTHVETSHLRKVYDKKHPRS
ncbi:MAG: tyrosine-type recombinase/integrase [Candidatus Dependentiae bacterium]|nr:tyrosine-type recombinase/integrase [Candidatus Dependentiae bacterium]